MEKKTYQITFMADLNEDDVRAMKKCFYDAMLESMQISPVWNLKLEEVNLNSCDTNPEDTEDEDVEESSPEAPPSLLEKLLSKPMLCLRDAERCFEVCKSKNDVRKVLAMIPNGFGDFVVEFNDEYKEFFVTNTYFDDDAGELEEEYCYEYPEDWDFEDEWHLSEM